MKIKDTVLSDYIDIRTLDLVNEVYSKESYSITNLEDYSKIYFNEILDSSKKKFVKEIRGRAVELLSLVKEYNLIIDSRSYNILRYLELNR